MNIEKILEASKEITLGYGVLQYGNCSEKTGFSQYDETFNTIEEYQTWFSDKVESGYSENYSSLCKVTLYEEIMQELEETGELEEGFSETDIVIDCINKYLCDKKYYIAKSLLDDLAIIDDENIDEENQCIVDFEELDLSVAGIVIYCTDGSRDIYVNDEAIIYNPTL